MVELLQRGLNIVVREELQRLATEIAGFDAVENVCEVLRLVLESRADGVDRLPH